MDKIVTAALSGALMAGLFTGCSSTPSLPASIAKPPLDVTKLPDLVPVKELPSATGNSESYQVFGQRYYVLGTSEGFRQTGIASWYGADFHGKKTSSGPPFDMFAISAAHKNLPLPTYVRVTHLGNGRSIVVKVNDRGPFVSSRIIDLSYAAAAKLGMLEEGTAPVEVAALPPFQYLPGSPSQTNRAFAAQRTPTAPTANQTVTAPRPAPAIAASHSAPATTLAVSSPASYASFSPRPLATPTPTARPVSLPSLADHSAPLLYLQVGAFAESSRAKQLQQKLASRFRQAVRVDSSIGTLHRVRMGPFASAEEAEQIVVKLASLGIKAQPVIF